MKAEYFGNEWLAANPRHPPRYMGTIRGWKHKTNRDLYILWEGNARCTGVSMAQLMGFDDDGASVDAQLHDYEDGLPAPTYVEPVAVAPPSRCARGQAAAEAATGDDDAADDEDPVEEDAEAAPAEADVAGLKWVKLAPDGCKEDARSDGRFKPNLNDVVELLVSAGYSDPGE